MAEQSCETRDLARGWTAWLLWGLPILALLVGSSWQAAQPLLGILAFLTMGVACLANAARCGRWHCYLTGPICLLAAAYIALSAFHLLPMRSGVFSFSVLGLIAIAFLAEVPLGKYRKKARNQ